VFSSKIGTAAEVHQWRSQSKNSWGRRRVGEKGGEKGWKESESEINITAIIL
jgi:hypothetical protein